MSSAALAQINAFVNLDPMSKIKETLNHCTKRNQKGNIIGERISFMLKHPLPFLSRI